MGRLETKMQVSVTYCRECRERTPHVEHSLARPLVLLGASLSVVWLAVIAVSSGVALVTGAVASALGVFVTGIVAKGARARGARCERCRWRPWIERKLIAREKERSTYFAFGYVWHSQWWKP